MTKEQYIEIVKGILTSADPNPDVEEKYHEARIELFISMAFNDIIYQVFARNLDETDLYVRTYTVDVEFDTIYGQYFADLPARVLQLPRNMGIHKISPVRENWSFVPINQLSEEVFNELEVNNHCTEPSYFYTPKRVFFQNYDWKNRHIKKLRLDIVIPFEEYDDKDEIVIPAGKESTILGFVTQMLGQQLPADHTTNINDTQV